jgi:hypothetical protein
MFIMTFVALLGPALFTAYLDREFNCQLMAMTWEARYWDHNIQIVVVQPYMLTIGLLLFSLRPVFAYQMVRYYKGRTTKLNTLLVGVASELQVLVVTNLMTIGQLVSSPNPSQILVPLFGPTPVLFLTGLVIMKLRPPPEITTPWQQMEERKQRWDKDAAAPESKLAQSSSKEVVVGAAKEKQNLAETAED